MKRFKKINIILMNIISGLMMFSFFKRFGSSRIKGIFWNKEFLSGKWDYLDTGTSKGKRKDRIYHYIEKYSKNGNILDLGCGTGRIGRELKLQSYAQYTGVDISDVALQKAKFLLGKGTERISKNDYYVSDILTYVPSKKYNIVLFQESLYYLNKYNIFATLNKYIKFLDEHGVIIVRLHDRYRFSWIIKLLEKEYKVLDKFWPADKKMSVIVFRGRNCCQMQLTD